MISLLQDYASEQATRRPDAAALVFKAERMTYAELERASNRLANLLREAGVRRGDRVCLLTPKSPRAVVAMHGVLKAGAIYVPLDPGSPAARLEKMIAACDDRWILGSGTVARTLDALFDNEHFAARHALGWLGAGDPPGAVTPRYCWDDLAALPDTLPPTVSTTRDAAHILFTSGSTGMPKGVVITHENVRRFVDWAVAYFGTTSSDRISGHPPLHFDLSTFDIFGTMAAGAELHLVPPELNLLPNLIADFIRSTGLTQWFSVPTTLNLMAKLDVVRHDDFPALRRMLWCGERLPTPSLIYMMRRLPHVSFTNLYGPTETTIASSYYTVRSCPESPDHEIPIGAACAGEELLVLDDQLRRVAPGRTGDLYIGGAGLSPGYWRDDDKTALAFRRRPGARNPDDRIYRTGDLAKVGADGFVRYVGRADFQIKSRGYRIDAGEIETALHALGTLRECAVVGVASDDGDGTAICCAYVADDATTTTAALLRDALRRSLPAYMLPSRWLTFDTLPKTSNGKIDRRRLQECFAGAPVGAI
jgi:amino acid adenylation domain-containing protein